MSLRLAADLKVDSFGVVVDGDEKKLEFPRAEADELQGSSGRLSYGVHELVLDKLRSRLDRMHWAADAGSAGRLWLRVDDETLEMTHDRLELPHGILLARAAESRLEIRAPHASFSDVKLSIPSLAALRSAPAAPDDERDDEITADDRPSTRGAAAAPRRPARRPLRQGSLHVLDALQGEVSFTVRIQLDLPVIGVRTFDQTVRIQIKDGSLDFRSLEDGLGWLEGAILAIRVEGRRLVVSWGVPIVAPAAREIISWELDDEAMTLAAFDRVPLRALVDFRLPRDDKPRRNERKKSILRSLTLGNIQARLSLTGSQSVSVGGGTVMFGGDDAPGILDLVVSGSLTHPPSPGGLLGAVGVIDGTLKDVRFGNVSLTADRLHLGAIETIGITFDGFKPVGLVATLTRGTATGLSLFVGSARHDET